MVVRGRLSLRVCNFSLFQLCLGMEPAVQTEPSVCFAYWGVGKPDKVGSCRREHQCAFTGTVILADFCSVEGTLRGNNSPFQTSVGTMPVRFESHAFSHRSHQGSLDGSHKDSRNAKRLWVAAVPELLGTKLFHQAVDSFGAAFIFQSQFKFIRRP